MLLDGDPVRATEGHVVQTPTTVLVEDVVSVEVRPGTAPDALVERVHAAREALDARCAELGVADLAEAKAVAAERRDAGRRLESSRSTLAGLLGDESFEDAERRLATLAAGLDDELPDEPLEELERQLREAEEAEPTSEAAAEEARREFETARERTERAGGEVIRMDQAVETLEEVVTELRSSLARAQQTASDEALGEAVAAAEQESRTRDAAREAAQEALSGEDAETLRILLDNASAGLDEATEAISRARDDVAGTKALLDDRAAEGIYDQLVSARAELEAQRSEVERTERRAAAAALLHDVVHRQRDDAHLAYLEPFRRHIQRLGRVIFGHDFDVEIGPDLRIEARILDGRRVPFDHLSGGAKEQLALLGRLATAQLVDPAEGAPLILDDALGFTDPDRLHALSAVLNDVGGQAQIVLLTCQPSRYATLGRARRVRL